MTERELAHALEHESGLLGLSGAADMREVLARSAAGDPAAVLGLEVYLHRLRAEVAAMTASLGGVDALVFTGGVGQNSAEIRARAVLGLGFLGVAIDEPRNAHAAEDAPVSTLVIRAREDLEIARQVRATLSP